MITLRPGSHAYDLLLLLSYTGEIPMKQISLLGSMRSWRDLIYKLNKPQEFRFPDSDERITCRLLTLNGSGRLKSIRLYKAALPVLKKMDPTAYRYYMDTFSEHHFSGDESHIDRNHRVAEAIMMCLSSGAETVPQKLPQLYADRFLTTRDFPSPCFYTARDLKKIKTEEINKIKFTRIAGVLVGARNCYAVYNSRNALMKWMGHGERKAQEFIGCLIRPNPSAYMDSSILFGSDMNVALRTLREADRTKRWASSLVHTFLSIHYITMNAFGVRLLKILTTPGWQEILMDSLFGEEIQTHFHQFGALCFEKCDAYDAKNDLMLLSHLDADICRLTQFKEYCKTTSSKACIVCYPEQQEMIKAYFGKRASVFIVTMDQVEACFRNDEED